MYEGSLLLSSGPSAMALVEHSHTSGGRSKCAPIGPLARFGGLLVPLRSHTLVLAHTHLRIMFGESTAALLRCARPSGFET